MSIAQIQDHIFGGACPPVAKNTLEQFPPALEVVVETASGDLQFLGQRIDPDRVDTAGDQNILGCMYPIFASEVGA
ncbi:hypothetical protein D3C75_1285970 [compost metagenome]